MAELVDLSLFSSSPNSEGHFGANEDPFLGTFNGPRYPSAQAVSTMKPLPPVPQQRMTSFGPDHRSQLCYPSRVILHKMRRLRVETSPSLEPGLERPARSRQTLQQRRRRDQIEAVPLTLPLNSNVTGQTSGSAVRSRQQPPPMIWLADEQTWLVPESAAQDQELYGYYAPAPHSDPGPWQVPPPPRYTNDSPPSYSNSSVSSANISDFSPIRTQFLTLMEPRVNQQVQSATSEPSYYRVRDDRAVSPLFQEALSGVGFVPSFAENNFEADIPAPIVIRKESVAFVSPLSPETDRRPMPWSIPRPATARM